MVRDALGLKNKVYVYDYKGKDGMNRAPQAMLIVREVGNLKNIIAPFFLGRLLGNKGRQFKDWVDKIGDDPLVPDIYRIIAINCRSGFYEKRNYQV